MLKEVNKYTWNIYNYIKETYNYIYIYFWKKYKMIYNFVGIANHLVFSSGV